jgi:hypothetical protein
MKEETVLGYLKTKFTEEQKSRIEFLAEGKANSMEEYKNVAGVIRGLALATEILEDLVHRLEKSDE